MGNLVKAENEMVLLAPSAAHDYWTKEVDIFQSEPMPSSLDQLRRRLLVPHRTAGRMRSKKDQNGPATGKGNPTGFYGGHNPSGRIRILKL